jgi:hypothetical protein
VVEEGIKSIRKEESRDQLLLACQASAEDYKTDTDPTSFSTLGLLVFYEISQAMRKVDPSYPTDSYRKIIAVVLPRDQLTKSIK